MVVAKTAWVLGILVAAALVALLFAVACTYSTPEPGQDTSEPVQPPPTPTDAWAALLQRTPFPYTTPLPEPTRTMLDGIYAKLDPREATPVPCKRCPDYAPEGGIWKLNLDRGVFRIYYQVTSWRSLGSFTVAEERLLLFSDPHCPDLVGTYSWTLEDGELILKVVQDECAIGLRARNLTERPWLSCQPPSTEAGITGHWPKPPGCD